jgi:transcriptional regulator with XRE-family HTH domain
MLKRLRKKKGLSQLELAGKTGLPHGYLSELEAGKKKNPSLKVLQKLALGLGVTVSELLEGG